MNEQKLMQAYREETNAKVRERMLLVKFVRFDGETPVQAAEKLGHPRAWGDRWMKRYSKGGLRSLYSKKQTGRPPKVPPKKMKAIMKEMKENLDGYIVH